MNLKVIHLPENWFIYRMKREESINEIKSEGHRPYFRVIIF